MNFYAHLMAAAWQSQDPAFALGSMLPDFATMVGLRLPPQSHAELAAGVHFHHQSDRAFHSLREFRVQETWSLQHMLNAGLRRGPARGIAHVGVELCLDGALVGDERADALYLAALHVALQSPPRLDSREADARFQVLAERLADIGVPAGYRDASVVGERLIRILEPRPLLRLEAEEMPMLMGAVGAMHDRVTMVASTIMRCLADALSAERDARSDEFSDRESP